MAFDMTKQISLADLDTLKRIMGMTKSVHDGEALAAIRKANKVLDKYSLTWMEVLGRAVTAATLNGGLTHEDIVEANGEISLGEQIRRAFDELRGVSMSRSFVEFLQSIEEQFKRTGYLSADQRKPLFTAVKNHREKRRRDE